MHVDISKSSPNVAIFAQSPRAKTHSPNKLSPHTMASEVETFEEPSDAIDQAAWDHSDEEDTLFKGPQEGQTKKEQPTELPQQELATAEDEKMEPQSSQEHEEGEEETLDEEEEEEDADADRIPTHPAWQPDPQILNQEEKWPGYMRQCLARLDSIIQHRIYPIQNLLDKNKVKCANISCCTPIDADGEPCKTCRAVYCDDCLFESKEGFAP